MKEGNQTTEWTVTKWIIFVVSLLGLVAGALTGALPASGAVEASHMAVTVLGIITSVCAVVGGGVAHTYIKGRTELKKVAGTPAVLKAVSLEDLQASLKDGQLGQ